MPTSRDAAFLQLQKEIRESLPGLIDIYDTSSPSGASFKYPVKGKAGIFLSKENPLAELAHEGVHAKRFFYDSPGRKIREILAKSSLYNISKIHKLQAMGVPLAFILSYPSYAIPVLQAVVTGPMIYEEIAANRAGLKKLKQLGVSSKEIAKTRMFYLKNFSTYPAKLMLIPLLTAAFIRYKKGKKEKELKKYRSKKVVTYPATV